ncbi:hypothetical protein Taro_011510 [Colocasia esculenta]|uniref:Uncharacterized protein n=1 Tax=Colocasia esculenta TaxID=4460 RepID=A0A843UGA6_COLES|nr:hypothetical protein [Colocasia esculenta]
MELNRERFWMIVGRSGVEALKKFWREKRDSLKSHRVDARVDRAYHSRQVEGGRRSAAEGESGFPHSQVDAVLLRANRVWRADSKGGRTTHRFFSPRAVQGFDSRWTHELATVEVLRCGWRGKILTGLGYGSVLVFSTLDINSGLASRWVTSTLCWRPWVAVNMFLASIDVDVYRLFEWVLLLELGVERCGHLVVAVLVSDAGVDVNLRRLCF